MLIPFLVSKIHQAHVTDTNIHYSGSMTLDEDIMKAANLKEYQKIEIYNISNGSRLSTYVIQGEKGSKQVVVNGAAAHLVSKGDVVIIAAYALIDEKELNSLQSVILLMNEKNEVAKILNGKL